MTNSPRDKLWTKSKIKTNLAIMTEKILIGDFDKGCEAKRLELVTFLEMQAWTVKEKKSGRLINGISYQKKKKKGRDVLKLPQMSCRLWSYRKKVSSFLAKPYDYLRWSVILLGVLVNVGQKE